MAWKTALIAMLWFVADSTSLRAAESPNVILILLDDLGYADLSCYGSAIATPNIDRLASEGTRLNSFYTAGCVCTPTRSSIMTGCYPKRVGLHQHVLFPISAKGMNPDEITLAELARSRNYATAIVGKWHLGDQPVFLPTRQGFQSYFGIPYSNDMGRITQDPNKMYMGKRPPTPLLRDEKVIESEPDQRLLTKRYTDESLAFIERNRKQPFFLYLAQTMPHAPLFVSEAHAGKSGQGLFGDVVRELDHEIGRLLDKLREWELDKNTIVVFLSDNGGPSRANSSNAPFRGSKASNWEGGHRTTFIARYPSVIPAGKSLDQFGVSFDLYPTLAGWMGAEMPRDRTIDGRDLRPLLTGKDNSAPHQEFVYYTAQGKATGIRRGDWKYLETAPNNNRSAKQAAKKGADKDDPQPAPTPLLFNVVKDPGESDNKATAEPKLLAELRDALAKHRSELGENEPGPKNRPVGMIDNPQPLLLNNP